LEIVKILTEGGANIYAESVRADGANPQDAFDYAVAGGYPRIAKYLWDASDKVSFKTRTAGNLLVAYPQLCSRVRQQAARELVVFLLDNLASPQLASDSLFVISSNADCTEQIRFLLDRGVTPAPRAVVVASAWGSADLVALYVQRGADVNAVARDLARADIKTTPLIAAAGSARLQIVELLLSAGANANQQSTDGRTALIAAVAEGGCTRVEPKCEERLGVMSVLIKYGARPDLRDRNNKSALDYLGWYTPGPYIDKKRAILNRKN